ncbi:hypothetical protein ACEWY4_024804 [Coilia grayii]|uniref:SGNH hydrolase-type esterase domain-containing protein n=1 Tax=Coilia grayii TaxID=363190 RepID=A0ABD1IXT4_9TELE
MSFQAKIPEEFHQFAAGMLYPTTEPTLDRSYRSPSKGSTEETLSTLPRSETWCLPGARVEDVQVRVPEVADRHPIASAIVVHIGSNDIRLQQSKKLKSGFTSLIQTILATGKKYILFSRIRQLHVWLMGYCSRENIPFADNFGSFWRKSNLFARDGRHLNRAGASLLASNLVLALEAHQTPD